MGCVENGGQRRGCKDYYYYRTASQITDEDKILLGTDLKMFQFENNLFGTGSLAMVMLSSLNFLIQKFCRKLIRNRSHIEP